MIKMFMYYKEYFIPRLFRWTSTHPKVLFFSILALPFAVIMRLIRPFYHVRIGGLTSQRMGHYTFDIEFYLSEKKYFPENYKTHDFFYNNSKPVVNEYVEVISRRHLVINDVFKYVDFASRALPFFDIHRRRVGQEINGSRDTSAVFSKIPPSLYFTSEEDRIGYDYLESNGIHGDFVCLLVRDSAYFNVTAPDDDTSYHDYRDVEIQRFNETVEYLGNNGLFTVRMGKYVNEKLPNISKFAFDYANSGTRSDFLDLWLASKCLFGISTAPGIETALVCFRKPLLLACHLPYGAARTGNRIGIELPKYILDSDGGYMGLREQIRSNLIYGMRTEEYPEVMSNTPEEILNGVKELIRLMDDSLDMSQEDKRLQNEYWGIMSTWDRYKVFHGLVHPIISPSFLRKNQRWLLN